MSPSEKKLFSWTTRREAAVGIVAQKCDKSFVPSIINEHWVWKLTETLKKGGGET
jgi:hypothetical protein